MRLKSSLISLKSKLSKSCNRFISFFHARFHNNVNTTTQSSSSSLLSRLCFLSSDKEQRMSQIRPRSSPSSLIDDSKLLHSRKMFPLAVTQRNKKARTSQRHMLKEDGVKEACRNFENYMIHMIVEDGKLDDLMDMEELLYYWKHLNSPIFIDLVTRFYGELCTDLFPSDNDG
ncbi:Ovate protein family C-terminal [Arabidopsis suecica]|uniref:Ovate protein family C-terminal n=1 Tax=Arabidopsis suecica TaxID=45249 RepID=A0A8T2H2M6_ARASU|nr:Ovate protein family C-terminal [Arabidopsis suecica]